MNEGTSDDIEFQFAGDCVIVESGSDSTSWEANEIITIYEGGSQICSSWNDCEVEVSVYYQGKLIAGDRGLTQLYWLRPYVIIIWFILTYSYECNYNQ